VQSSSGERVRLFAPKPGDVAAHAVRAYDFAPLAAAIELGSLSVSDEVRTWQSIVFMAGFNARRIGTSWWSLAILWVMGHPRHFRPLVEVGEVPKVGSTCGLATQLSVDGSRWQLALTYNAAASIKVVMTATATERFALIGDRRWQPGTAFGIAAVLPQCGFCKLDHD
jgi:hypothetical protein